LEPDDYKGLLCSSFFEPAEDSELNSWNYDKI
jgi:hypothetical protein